MLNRSIIPIRNNDGQLMQKIQTFFELIKNNISEKQATSMQSLTASEEELEEEFCLTQKGEALQNKYCYAILILLREATRTYMTDHASVEVELVIVPGIDKTSIKLRYKKDSVAKTHLTFLHSLQEYITDKLFTVLTGWYENYSNQARKDYANDPDSIASKLDIHRVILWLNTSLPQVQPDFYLDLRTQDLFDRDFRQALLLDKTLLEQANAILGLPKPVMPIQYKFFATSSTATPLTAVPVDKADTTMHIKR